MKDNNRACRVALIVCAALAVLLFSGVTGLHVVNDSDYTIIDRYARLEEIRQTLESDYYRDVNDDVLIKGAIDGMMASLGDRYTFYYTPEEMTAHDEAEEGSFVGIGVLVQQNEDGEIEIVRVYDGSPAQEGKLSVGDCIISVDGEAVNAQDEQSFTEGVNRIRRETGKAICLGIKRGVEQFEVILTCSDVSVSNVESLMLDGRIGYIAIYQFSGDDVTAFEAALEELQNEGAQGLIIDLRDNPGGLLDDVVEIADELLPEGLIVYTQSRDGEREEFYSDADYCDLPMVVLVNDMSASASEILAAALQDYERATIVGVTTYGKGIVQTMVRFGSDGAGMQYTSACYYMPSGRSIHGEGVIPDVVVEAAEGDIINAELPNPQTDTQLRIAIGELKKSIG